MSTSRKKNQKSTPTRGATALNSTFTRKSQSSSNNNSEDNSDSGSTFVRPTTSTGSTETTSRPTGRVDHPTTKYDYIEQVKQEEQKQEQEQERPTGRVDHPTTKYDYIEQVKQEEQQQEQERPTGRVDHPTGKYQYLEDEEKVPAANVADNSDVVIEYTLKVVSAGPNAEKVADLVLGTGWRRRNINLNNAFSCTMASTKASKAFEMAQKAVELGAKVEFKKSIMIEVTII